MASASSAGVWAALQRRVCARQITLVEREVSQRLVSGLFEVSDYLHARSKPSAASLVRRPYVTLENSCLYSASPEIPCIFASSRTNNMNTSSDTSHSHLIPWVLAGLNPNRG